MVMQLNINDDQLLDMPDGKTVRSVVANLSADQFAILSIDDDHYIQVFLHPDGTYQLEYRDGSADHHFAADPDDIAVDDVASAFEAFLRQTDDWHSAWKWQKLDFDEDDDGQQGYPETLLICHDDYHAKHVGWTSSGNQFFLTTPFVPARDKDPGCQFIALFLFDQLGNLTEAQIDKLGPRATMDRDEARQRYEQRLASLGEVEFCDIEIAPFKVQRFATTFGLIPRAIENEDDELYIELQPGNYMAFHPPWNGEYDT